jgi:uncharacterized membrane protein
MKYLGWAVFIFFAIAIGLYPFAYLFSDMKDAFLSTKPRELFFNTVWHSAFYVHIITGGTALLIGPTQFSKHVRQRYLNLHRLLGKCYLISVMLSGVSGLYIAMYASGGIVSAAGFGSLALAWLFTSSQAYLTVRKKEITQHQYWMIRSYALCWAAVTLRIMLPLSQVFAIDFLVAYRAIAWLCWVPNLIVAEIIIRNLKTSKVATEVV